jgi:predicted secreted protein
MSQEIPLDVRSNRFVFVSHCILAQGVMATGIVRRFPAIVKPVVQFCLDHDINIVQMPCPESQCAAGGLGRSPHGKKWYEERGLREVCHKIATEQVAYMKDLLAHGFQVVAIVGVEFSPACAASLLNLGRCVVHGKGIFAEELQSAMRGCAIEVPLIGVNQRGLKKLERTLLALLNAK